LLEDVDSVFGFRFAFSHLIDWYYCCCSCTCNTATTQLVWKK